MSNIFTRLGSSFGGEDFFTATVGLFVERNPTFRDAFLTWLEDACGEPLRGYAWQVELQSSSPSCVGGAILDMKLRHPEVELWFEHKIGAPLGRYKGPGQTIDQLEKYLDAAARRMCGIDTGREEVEWPAQTPVVGQPRVILFYISRSGTTPQREHYEGRLHSPKGFGLAWPAAGPLRWRDFWPRAKVAFEPVLAGEAGEFERTLTQQFVNYWQSLRGMWLASTAGSDWGELLKHEEGERLAFEPLMDGICKVASAKLRWPDKGNYLGVDRYFEVPHGPIEQLTVWPERSRDTIPVASHELPNEVMQLQFRLRDDAFPLPAPGQRAAFERWRGVTGLGKSKGRRFLRIFVGVTDWADALTQEQRTRAVTGAFVAGLSMFQQLTGVALPGVEEL